MKRKWHLITVIPKNQVHMIKSKVLLEPQRKLHTMLGRIPMFSRFAGKMGSLHLYPQFPDILPIYDSKGINLGHRSSVRDITDRKRAEEALRDREEELASIYENTPLIMLLVDKEWTIRKTNAFTAQFVGRAVGDTINLRCGESLHCIHSLDATEGCGFGPSCGECTLRLTAINTIETGQGHHEVEASMSLSDGRKKREVIFLLSTARLTIKRQPMALVGMRDITERKRAEEDLRQSEEKWRLLVSNSPDFIALHDLEGRYLFLNHYADGFTEKDVIGKKAYEFVSQESRAIYRTAFEECISTMTKQIAEYSAMGSSAKERIYESTLVPIIGQGNEISVLVVANDITERKRMEEEKRRLEERSHKLVDDVFRFIPEGVLVFSRKMELLRQNQAFRELVSRYARRLGFDEDELENLIIDKIKAGLGDNNIKEIKIARKYGTGQQT